MSYLRDARTIQLAVFGRIWRDSDDRCLTCGTDTSKFHPEQNIANHINGICMTPAGGNWPNLKADTEAPAPKN